MKVLLRDCSFKVADLFDWKGKRLEINRSPNFNSTCSRPSAPNSSPFLEPLNTLLSWNSSQTSFICSTLIEEHGKTTKLTERKTNPSALNKTHSALPQIPSLFNSSLILSSTYLIMRMQLCFISVSQHSQKSLFHLLSITNVSLHKHQFSTVTRELLQRKSTLTLTLIAYSNHNTSAYGRLYDLD